MMDGLVSSLERLIDDEVALLIGRSRCGDSVDRTKRLV
jgi:hypothetical protein